MAFRFSGNLHNLGFSLLCAYSLLFYAPAKLEAQGLGAELANDTVNAVLLLDNSGSMLDNDPQRLRDSGVKLFMQFLKQGDNLGVISFSDNAEIVRPLSPFLTSEIDSIGAKVSKIEPTGQYTDITTAIEAAQTMLASSSTTDSKNVVILLSDGKLDPAPSVGSKGELLDKLVLRILPAFQAKSIPVYTLAFSGDADKALLGKIADMTEGVNWFTPTSDKIHESFAELFLSVKKPQVAPASAKGFRIDPDIDEATFYLNRVPDQEVYLESPKGRVFTSKMASSELRWFQSEKFDVITIEKPEAGEWKLAGVSQDEGFATILTKLKLVSTFPTALSLHKPALLRAQLYDGKLPVQIPEMGGVVKYAFQIISTDKVAEPIVRDFLNDEGKDGDEKAGDGIFSKKVPMDEEGEYRLRIVAKSPTFERQQSVPFRVRPPVLSISIVKQEAHENGEGGEEHGTPGEEVHDEQLTEEEIEEKKGGDEEVKVPLTSDIRVTINESEDFLKNVKVTLTAVDRKKGRYSIPLKQVGKSGMIYSAKAALLPNDGKYSLSASLQGTNRAGKTIREDSDPLLIHRLPSANKEVPEEIIVTEHVEKEPFPLIPFLLAVVGNGIIGAIGYLVLNTLTRKGSGGIAITPLPPEVEAGIVALTKAKEIQSLQIDDPRYAEAQQS